MLTHFTGSSSCGHFLDYFAHWSTVFDVEQCSVTFCCISCTSDPSQDFPVVFFILAALILSWNTTDKYKRIKIRVSWVGQSSNPLPILALIFTFGYWWPKRTFLFWAKLSIHTCFDCIQIITAVVISSPQLNCSLKPLPPFSLTLLKIIIVIRIEAACVGNVANSVIELTQADSVHFFMIVNCTLAVVVVGWFCAIVELNPCTF